MNIEIIEFKMAIKEYVKSTNLPEEVKRMALKEIYDEAEKEANNAALKELSERENNNMKNEEMDEEAIEDAESAQS